MNRQSRLVRYIFMNQMELQKLYFLSKIKKKTPGKVPFPPLVLADGSLLAVCVHVRK